MSDKPTLAEWWDRLNALDWYYWASDDHATYRRGSDARAAMWKDALLYGTPYQDMFTAFEKSTDPSMHTDRPPRPQE